MCAAKKKAPKKQVAKPSQRATAESSRDTASNAIDEQLERYRSMRNFGVTAEPSGSVSTSKKSIKARKPEALPFCIQKHAASHLHYDFRLGWNGVLKSWAVAKGPSYVVADKRLAVQVEDHPIEYGGFEGIIPAGQYGGGTVMLWDQGTWEPQPGHTDVDAGLKSGQLKFILNGTKMHGKWALIRMGGKAATERKPNWLLIKEHDDFEQPPNAPSVTEAQPNSVVTGRSIEEIAGSEDHVWNSKDTAGKKKAWYRQERSHGGAQPTATGLKSRALPAAPAKRLNFDAKLKQMPQESQPAFIKPQLALEAERAPEGTGWLHELKLDGYRMQARKDGGSVQMLTRSGLDWTAKMPSVADAVRGLPVGEATLDGEVVVVSETGTTIFADLQASFQDGANHPLTYFCFDLLHLEGHSTRDCKLIDRKALLAEILQDADPAVIRLSEHIETDGQRMFEEACRYHAEGIVSKRAQSKYSPGRGGDWLKLKCLHQQEFVIGGYTLLSNGNYGVGALLLGYYKGGKLIYAGRTGTGFTQKSHRSVRDRLEAIGSKACPFANVPAESRKGAQWVKPELVAQVRFANWTADNQLRQAAFLGLREDKPVSEVIREEAAPAPKRSNKQSAAAATDEAHQEVTKLRAANEVPVEQKAPIRLTHPDKVLDRESGMTKQMLADYYWAIAEHMLPHIADRPISLVRCPDGASKPCFYQKHVSPMLPKDIGTIMVADKKTGKPEPYITLNTREALAGLAQMSVLEIHPWGSKNEDLEHADRIIFDLDPDESLSWSAVTEAALDVRSRLKNIGLESFVKTTGGKGLHVVIAISPQHDWNTIKTFSHHFVLAMENAAPSRYLSKMTKAARAGKIYLDYLRNERGATSVAPYSPRSRAGGPVSMPLAWSELKSQERPVFRVANFNEWRARLKKDPWASLSKIPQVLTLDAMSSVGMKA
jgi:bifunctional non-homologous end joining protein LigD